MTKFVKLFEAIVVKCASHAFAWPALALTWTGQAFLDISSRLNDRAHEVIDEIVEEEMRQHGTFRM